MFVVHGRHIRSDFLEAGQSVLGLDYEAVRPVYAKRLAPADDGHKEEGISPNLPQGIVDRDVARWHREVQLDGEAERAIPKLEEPEAQPSEGLKRVDMPTPQEVRDHERTHLPFRSWCKHCVFGRAKNEPHRKVDKEDHDDLEIISPQT